MALVAKQLDPFADRSEVESIWRALADISPPSYFLSWPWVENWLATLPRRGVRIRLVCVSENGVPVVACFVGRRTILRAGFIPSRALYLNATGHPEFDEIVIEHNAWLARSPKEWPLARLVRYLPRGWDELYLDAMDKEALAGTGPRWPSALMVDRVAPCPVVDLEKVRTAKEGYVSLLGGETRSQIKRSIRLYQARGPLVLEVAEDLETGRKIFSELVALHQATWTQRDKDGAFAQAYLSRFHERLIDQRFAHGEIQLARLRAGERTVGCLYNFLWHGVVSFYQSGLAYDEDKRLKPGLVCHVEAVAKNADAGRRTYDFLGGDARYKRSLSTDASELVWARVQKPRPQFFLEKQLRSARDRWRKIQIDRAPKPAETGQDRPG